jgi:hypothetical protein
MRRSDETFDHTSRPEAAQSGKSPFNCGAFSDCQRLPALSRQLRRTADPFRFSRWTASGVCSGSGDAVLEMSISFRDENTSPERFYDTDRSRVFEFLLR